MQKQISPSRLVYSKIARELRDKRFAEKKRTLPQIESVGDVIDLLTDVSASPPVKLSRDHPLKVLCDLMERAIKEKTEAAASTPSQHGKTTAILASLLFYHFQRASDPSKVGSFHMYVTHTTGRAGSVQDLFIAYAQQLGLNVKKRNIDVDLDGGRYASDGRGTTVRFVGIDGPITGESVSGILIVDDSVKNWIEAQSASAREKLFNSYKSACLTRNAFSYVVIQTRWSTGDLVGKCIDELKYEYLRVPAICDSEDDPLGRAAGEPLWPERYSGDWYEKKREQDPKMFSCMFQGSPFNDGERLFEIPTYYEGRPWEGNPLKFVGGLDLATSERSVADWCVSVVLVQDTVTGFVYLFMWEREREPEDRFIHRVKAQARDTEANFSYHWAWGGQELSIAKRWKREGVRIVEKFASKNKRDRVVSSGVDRAWNTGKLLVPRMSDDTKVGRTLNAIIDEIVSFTGNDVHDDCVDSLASAFKGLVGGTASLGFSKEGSEALRNKMRERNSF